MARAVHRSGLVALGIATALMASCAFAAKDVVGGGLGIELHHARSV
ncbi:peptide transporter periplasmic-binding protein [Escherichia coli]|nr:peptide transporter periplasmic-binding protein [Escherichia coli]